MEKLYIPIKKGKKQGADFSEIKTIGDNVLYGCFNNCSDLKTIPSFSNLISVGENGLYLCFNNCKNMEGVISFPKLEHVDERGFQNLFTNCANITGNPSFPELTTIGDYSMAYMFRYCTNISGSVNFTKLATITGQYAMRGMFSGCVGITSISFPSLSSTSFPGSGSSSTFKNFFNDMLSGVTGCTVHFPSNLQSVIGSWPDVTAGFGGTNTTVLFDLPATT